MMRRSLLPDASGNQVEADAVIHAGLGYYLLERTITSAMGGGDNSIWTINKDPSADFCDSIDCGVHGTCIDLGVCECRDGYSGPECRDAPDRCKDIDCGTNGLCDGNTGQCQCYNRWFGPRCESYPPSEDCEASEYEQSTCRNCCMLTCGQTSQNYVQSSCIQTAAARGHFLVSECTCDWAHPCNMRICSDVGSNSCSGSSCNCNTGFAGTKCDHCATNRFGASCDPPAARLNPPNTALQVEFDHADMQAIVGALLVEQWGYSGEEIEGARPGTAIQAFIESDGVSYPISGLSNEQKIYLRQWILYQVDQLVSNELKNEMLLTTRPVADFIYGYSMHDALVKICAGWCTEPSLVFGWKGEGLIGPYRHNDNHTTIGRRSPTFAVKRVTRHNTGVNDLSSAWIITMRDGEATVDEWPEDEVVRGKDIEYGYLAPRLTAEGVVKEPEKVHQVWVERGLRAVPFVYESTESISGLEGLLYAMDPDAWVASESNQRRYGMNADWDPTGNGGTWPLRPASSPNCPAEGCSQGLRLPGCSYSMPYAFAKPPRRSGYVFQAGPERVARHRSTGTSSSSAFHSVLVESVDYDHRLSQADVLPYSHAGARNDSDAMHPSWSGLRSYMLVEPITGFMLEAAIRLQLNVELAATGVCIQRAKTWDGSASVQEDARRCAAVADLATATECESVETSGTDTNNGAIASVDGGAANSVTLSVANSDILPGHRLRLKEVEGLGGCAARPLDQELVVSAVNGAVITFSTDLTRGDSGTAPACRLTRTTQACTYSPHGSIFTREMKPQLFPMVWIDVGGRQSDQQLESFRSSVYGAIDFGQRLSVVFILMGVLQSVIGAACCVCRSKHIYGGVIPEVPIQGNRAADAWNTPAVVDPTGKARRGSMDSRQGRGRSRSRSRSRGHSRDRPSSRASSRASSRSSSRSRSHGRRDSVSSSRGRDRDARDRGRDRDRASVNGSQRGRKVTKHRLPKQPRPPRGERGAPGPRGRTHQDRPLQGS
eukprot:COSAG02_NODE_2614_length_8415_cov_84.832011_7_plen_1001_part_00